MAMHKAKHPSDNVDSLYVSRKEGEKGFARIEDSDDSSIRLGDNIENNEGGLITATRNNTNNTKANRMAIIRKQKWKEKQLINNISHEKP